MLIFFGRLGVLLFGITVVYCTLMLMSIFSLQFLDVPDMMKEGVEFTFGFTVAYIYKEMMRGKK